MTKLETKLFFGCIHRRSPRQDVRAINAVPLLVGTCLRNRVTLIRSNDTSL